MFIKSEFLRPFDKLIWSWETKIKQPIYKHRLKRLLHNLPPIEMTGEKCTLVILTTGDYFYEGILSAWSWARFLQDDCKLLFLVDGICEHSHDDLKLIIPNSEVMSTSDFLQTNAPAFLKASSFVNQHTLGRKFACLLVLQSIESVIFSDGDVLVFNDPLDIKNLLGESNALCYNQDLKNSVDPVVENIAHKCRVKMLENFNSGLLYVSKNTLNIELAENLLQEINQQTSSSWFTEQSLLNALFSHAGAKALPKEKYLVSFRGMFASEGDVDYQNIISRHFVTPIRFLFYTKGIPRLLN